MKTTLGKRFLKKFINLRESNFEKVAAEILKWLDEQDIDLDRHFSYGESPKGLMTSFFGGSCILHINPGKTNKVIIGKGVCFDTGGYDLKADMKDMFYDKNGSLLTIAAAIDNDCSAIVFFVSNFINDRVVAGQILKDKYTGLRVLIDDTDAEGRIGLAHCIGLAKAEGYSSILTIATLTGHAHMITGDRTYAMVHSNNPVDLSDILNQVIVNQNIFIDGAAPPLLELWPAPFHTEYDKSMDTEIIGADVRSCGSFKGAGTSTAFSFLKRFSKDTHHIHLDIAAMMLDKNRNGYTGFGWNEVPYLLSLL